MFSKSIRGNNVSKSRIQYQIGKWHDERTAIMAKTDSFRFKICLFDNAIELHSLSIYAPTEGYEPFTANETPCLAIFSRINLQIYHVQFNTILPKIILI